MIWKTLLMYLTIPACGVIWAVALPSASDLRGGGAGPDSDLADTYVKRVQPLLKKYCFECHSKKAHKGDLDLERFDSLIAIRKDLKPWQQLIEQVEAGEMPPKGKPQPTADERKLILAWVARLARRRGAGAGRRSRARAAAPAEQRRVRLHDPRPDRRRPAADARVPRRRRRRRGVHQRRRGALRHLAGAVHAYLNAAKDIADHAVLLPDGFRFAPARPAATGPTRARPDCASSTPSTPAATAGCRCSRTSRPRSAIATRWPPARSLSPRWPRRRS